MLSKCTSALFLFFLLTACTYQSSPTLPVPDVPIVLYNSNMEGTWVLESDCSEILTIEQERPDSSSLRFDNEFLYDEVGKNYLAYFDSSKQQFLFNTDTGVAHLSLVQNTPHLVSNVGNRYLYWGSNNPDVYLVDTMNFGTWSYNPPPSDGSDLFAFDLILKKNGLGKFIIGEGQDIFVKQSITGNSLKISRKAGIIAKEISELTGTFSKAKDSLTIKWPVEMIDAKSDKSKISFETRVLVLQKNAL